MYVLDSESNPLAPTRRVGVPCDTKHIVVIDLGIELNDPEPLALRGAAYIFPSLRTCHTRKE